METKVVKARAEMILLVVYLAVVLPVALVLMAGYLKIKKIRRRCKCGTPPVQVRSPNPPEYRKARLSEKWPQGSVIRDLADFFAVMWRNPEISFENAYHVFVAGKPRSEYFFYGWSAAFSRPPLANKEHATAVCCQGLELHPDSIMLREKLVELLKDAENWRGVAQEAAILAWFASGSRQYYVFVNLGYAQYRLGNYEAAVENYTKALDLQPDSAETASALSYCRAQLAGTAPDAPG